MHAYHSPPYLDVTIMYVHVVRAGRNVDAVAILRLTEARVGMATLPDRMRARTIDPACCEARWERVSY